MRREDDQALWDLLGRAAEPPRLSDFFARNVVRQARQRSAISEWFRWPRFIPASLAAALLLTGIVVAIEHPSWRKPVGESEPDVVAKIDPQDFEVVADLDLLVASDETNLWDDNQSL